MASDSGCKSFFVFGSLKRHAFCVTVLGTIGSDLATGKCCFMVFAGVQRMPADLQAALLFQCAFDELWLAMLALSQVALGSTFAICGSLICVFAVLIFALWRFSCLWFCAFCVVAFAFLLRRWDCGGPNQFCMQATSFFRGGDLALLFV